MFFMYRCDIATMKLNFVNAEIPRIIQSINPIIAGFNLKKISLSRIKEMPPINTISPILVPHISSAAINISRGRRPGKNFFIRSSLFKMIYF